MKRLPILAIAAGVVVLALVFRWGMPHDDEAMLDPYEPPLEEQVGA